MRITFLGTGTSHGVPAIDCMLNHYARCPHRVCLKAASDPRHRRSRASIAVEWPDALGDGGAHLLIDTSQDFRQQVLSAHLPRIDAVLYTHGHADHIYGLPDIRSYCAFQRAPIPIYGSGETLDILRRAFDYVFEPPEFVGGGIPQLAPATLEAPAEILGHRVTPIPVHHGALLGCQGYRIGDMAYLPDVKLIPPESLALLSDLDLLILNCLRPRPHGSHLSLEESLAYVEQLRPRRCLLTHMTHDIDYELHGPALPSGVAFAYDGLVVEALADEAVA
jgi:phosphoribosyl 1,2-cyclic phosphate phosphodiesterase